MSQTQQQTNSYLSLFTRIPNSFLSLIPSNPYIIPTLLYTSFHANPYLSFQIDTNLAHIVETFHPHASSKLGLYPRFESALRFLRYPDPPYSPFILFDTDTPLPQSSIPRTERLIFYYTNREATSQSSESVSSLTSLLNYHTSLTSQFQSLSSISPDTPSIKIWQTLTSQTPSPYSLLSAYPSIPDPLSPSFIPTQTTLSEITTSLTSIITSLRTSTSGWFPITLREYQTLITTPCPSTTTLINIYAYFKSNITYFQSYRHKNFNPTLLQISQSLALGKKTVSQYINILKSANLLSVTSTSSKTSNIYMLKKS